MEETRLEIRKLEGDTKILSITAKIDSIFELVQRKGDSGPFWVQNIKVKEVKGKATVKGAETAIGTDAIYISATVKKDKPFPISLIGKEHTFTDLKINDYNGKRSLRGRYPNKSAGTSDNGDIRTFIDRRIGDVERLILKIYEEYLPEGTTLEDMHAGEKTREAEERLARKKKLIQIVKINQKENDIPEEEYRNHLIQTYGQDSSTKLNEEELQELIEWVKGYQPQKKAEEEMDLEVIEFKEKDSFGLLEITATPKFEADGSIGYDVVVKSLPTTMKGWEKVKLPCALDTLLYLGYAGKSMFEYIKVKVYKTNPKLSEIISKIENEKEK